MKKLVLAALAVAMAVGLAGLHIARRAVLPAAGDLFGAASGANLVVVTIDTLRADHLAPYGDSRIDTPTIARLAREGVRFDSAYSCVPLTLPSHCSIFTGLLPVAHGVRDNSGFYLGHNDPTLAEVLKSAGYRTGGFVSTFVLDRRWGIARGFDDYYDGFNVSARDLATMAAIQRPAGETWARARAWLDQHASERFFLWLHYFDPHTPYDPPEPYRTQYADRPYDGEIAYVDSVLGELIADLETRALLDKTLIVLLSDHGEGLGDHGEDEHGLLLYDSTLRVPWIVRLPRGRLAGTVVRRAVSLVDVLPTTLDLLGLTSPRDIDGVSLTRLMLAPKTPGSDVLYAETYYPRLHFGWSELLGVRNEDFKLIRGARPRLYEYRRDPGELSDVASSHLDTVARLDQIVTRITMGKPTPQAAAPDPEAVRRLQSLGYVNGPAMIAPGQQGLADPDDKIEIYRTFRRAGELLSKASGRAEGVRALESLLAQEPALASAHRLLRDYWIGRREFAEAETWFRAKASQHRTDARFLVDLATVLQAAGKPTEALAVLKTALDRRPDDIEALTLSGKILRTSGQLDAALARFTRADDVSSDADVKMQIAETLIQAHRLVDAESVIGAALAANPHVQGAHYLRALIAEQRQNGATAEEEYRLEIQENSWDYKARFNLAVLIGQRGDYREQVKLLQSIPSLAPEFPDVYFYIAKALLDAGDPTQFDDAIAAARRGLQLAPGSPTAPLAHYVMADIYRLQGRQAESQREIDAGRELERRLANQGVR